jgi:hypothetical protein
VEQKAGRDKEQWVVRTGAGGRVGQEQDSGTRRADEERHRRRRVGGREK